MFLNRTTIALLSTGLLLGACDDKSPEKQVAEAKEEYREDVKDAKKIDDPEDRAEAMDDAKEELNEERAEAYEDEAHKDGVDGDADAAAGDDRGRFAALKDETDAAFVARAKSRIEAIDKEFEGLDATNRSTDEIKDVEKKLADARKELSDFDGDKIIGDGKLSITVAINSAERQLDDLSDAS